jgi:orotate phosphoribosyltransferase
MHLPFVYVRSKPKEHGMGKRIEGHLEHGKHVVLIEDLLSTGGSATSSVQALREEGQAIVTDVVAIFTYELHSAAEAAQEHRLKFHPLASLGTLLTVAAEQGKLTADEVSRVATFSKDPKAWVQ